MGRDDRVFRTPFAALLVAVPLLISCVGLLTPERAAANDFVPLYFEFVQTNSSFAPGDNFTVEFTVTNNYGNISGNYYYIKVTSISAYFSWMGTGEWNVTDLSSSSLTLYPGDAETFNITYQVPSDAVARTYGYKFMVDFDQWNTVWGAMNPDNTESTFNYGLNVAVPTPPPTNPGIDWLPLLGALAVLVVVAVAGVLLYTKPSSKGTPPGAKAAPADDALGMAEFPSSSSSELPIIRAAPGERFPIERGFVYLVKEKRPGIAFAMFREAVVHGAKGMVITREHPNRLKQTYEFEASRILWLTRRVGEDHVDPTELTRLSMTVSKFIEGTPKSVVLIEGLEYLITQNDFETVLRVVNHLHDFVLSHDCAVIIVLDPRVLSTRELALLERPARVVESGELSVVRPDRLAESADAK
jgi:hypothetical protein